MSEKMVYSTATGDCRDNKEKASDYKKSSGPCKMRLETSGRSGKTVTVLYNLPFTEEEAIALMKNLKSMLGCGATLKNSKIELQGDKQDRVRVFFVKLGKPIS